MTKGNAATISRIAARQILDSRGRPTVEADVFLADGTLGRACAPSGASTGRHEAWELRDNDPESYEGLGVLKAVANANGPIADALAGTSVLDQGQLDATMIGLDGTPSLERLGANAILAVSLAAARAAALHRRIPLHLHLAQLAGNASMTLPLPMTNILSGGAHAGRGMDIQDFLVMPVGAKTYGEALAMISRVRSAAAGLMEEEKLSILLADEGGLSPRYPRADQAMALMLRAFEAAKLRPGEDVAVALDIAASELYRNGRYELAGEGRSLDGEEMVAFLADLVARYPIVSIEDALEQDDWNHWRRFMAAVPDVQVVGDDLFATNQDRIARGAEAKVANAALIKLNQNGTLTGTLAAMETARRAGLATIVSARSGETSDSFIADLAVGTGAGQIKIGSVRNSERLSKYNQLSRIAEDGDLGFAGTSGVAGFQLVSA